VLSFKSKVLSAGRNESDDDIVNILRTTSLQVQTDIIEACYVKGRLKRVIYSIFPDTSPGEKIVHVVKYLIYRPVSINTIYSMQVDLLDQNDYLINLRGEELDIRFHIREQRW
jgi:hypothetical protein